jgi:O-antigen ligase
LTKYRPGWVDVPLALWCLTPMATSLSNGLGWYDGLHDVYGKCLAWAVPIILGRVYLADREGLLLFAKGLLLGALVYVPLCWIEIRFSPQLHNWIYGYFPHSFAQHIRYGGFRPIVFMPHGIAVSVYMAVCSALLLWLWRCAAMRKIAGIPAPVALAVLLATLVGCKTATGLALCVLAFGCFFVRNMVPMRLLLLGLLLTPPTYAVLRLSGALPASTLVDLVGAVDADRAGSLGARLRQEDLYSQHTWTRPVFGWGRWQRNIPRDEDGRPRTRGVDSFWVIALSQYGLFGLSAAMATMLLGPLLVCRRFSSREMLTPQLIPLTTLAMVACLCMFENLFNGLPNPLVYVAVGGLLQCAISPLRGFHSPGVSQRVPSLESISRKLSTGEPFAQSTTLSERPSV